MSTVPLLVVTSPNCSHCHRFLKFWETEGKEWKEVTMREVSILTPEGQALAQEHNIFASPGIIVGGELLFSGGYDEAKLRERLNACASSDTSTH